ncbi:MAG: ComEA family DNA-binding protein [Actinomycetota bacterium]|nr:ComEA family DNA-binding protein [Actinomycetota bacterium]
MPELSRAQIFVYAALAVVGLLLGARWIKAEPGSGSAESIAYRDTDQVASGSAVKVESGGEDLVVHVAGAVSRPGVYSLPFGSRVADAIERAGGASRDAEADAINLAAPLADGQQVQVPAKAPAGSAGITGGTTDGPISLGSATAEDLDTIEGIGPVTAAAILAFRDERGGVASIDDLDQVSGIGPATMEALRARLQP